MFQEMELTRDDNVAWLWNLCKQWIFQCSQSSVPAVPTVPAVQPPTSLDSNWECFKILPFHSFHFKEHTKLLSYLYILHCDIENHYENTINNQLIGDGVYYSCEYNR